MAELLPSLSVTFRSESEVPARFEQCDSLAHGRLGDAQLGRRGGKANLLRRPHERREVRKLGEAKGGR